MAVVSSRTITVEVNGVSYEREVEARKLLIHFLRDDLDLTGSHVGCDTGNCGACSVLFDGVLLKSCMLLAVQADGASIRTVEGLGSDGERDVPAEEFFLGVYMTAAGPGELLTKVTIPAGKGDGFASLAIGRDGTCIVNAAASLDGGAPRVAIGCVDAVPVLVRPESPEDDAVRGAVRAAGLQPPDDVHASAEYRRHLAEVLAVRAVRAAKERAA